MIVAAPLANLVIRRLGGNADRQEVGGRLNNRAENPHQPFRPRERAMQRFRSMKTLQKFSSVHAEVHNHSHGEGRVKSEVEFRMRKTPIRVSLSTA
jgi:putative transposase